MDQQTEDAKAEAWDLAYRIWQKYHMRAFGWNGPQGSVHAADLFELWDDWFYKLGPSEDELMAATQWAASQPDMFKNDWESHYAHLSRFIVTRRAALESEQRDAKLWQERAEAETKHKEHRRKLAAGDPEAVAEEQRRQSMRGKFRRIG